MHGAVRRVCRCVAVLVLIVMTACDAAETRNELVAVRDSGGVRIVETFLPTWDEEARWRLSAEPVIDLGGLNVPAHAQFHDVSDVERLRDGRIIVANAGTGEIRLFDADGGFVRAIGGEGGGPGEFHSLRSVHVVGLTLLAYDLNDRRVTGFAFDGRVLGTMAMDDRVVVASRFNQEPVWLRHGGLLLFGSARAPEEPEELQRPRIALLRFESTGSLLDTLAVVPGVEQATWEVDGRLLAGAPVPFSRQPVVAAGWENVYVGTQTEREVRVYNASGELEQLIRWQGPSLEIDGDDREQWERSYFENSTQSEAARQQVLRLLQRAPLPDQRPAYSELRVDAAGHLWVAEHYFRIPGLWPTQWRIFDEEGRMLGTVDVPERFEVHQVGQDFVLGVRRDAQDVEHVSLYRLRK